MLDDARGVATLALSHPAALVRLDGRLLESTSRAELLDQPIEILVSALRNRTRVPPTCSALLGATGITERCFEPQQLVSARQYHPVQVGVGPFQIFHLTHIYNKCPIFSARHAVARARPFVPGTFAGMSTTTNPTPHPLLLLWDSPNMDMTLSNLLGGQKPSKAERPDCQKLAEWVHMRAQAANIPARAVMALNVSRDAGSDSPLAKYVQVLRTNGFEVFLNPKDTPSSDVDDALVSMAASNPASELIVATHDSPLLARIREASSSPMSVLCFSEMLPCYRRMENVTFIDVAEVPGLFADSLPRLTTPSFASLPAEGLLLPPLGPLFREAAAEAA